MSVFKTEFDIVNKALQTSQAQNIDYLHCKGATSILCPKAGILLEKQRVLM